MKTITLLFDIVEQTDKLAELAADANERLGGTCKGECALPEPTLVTKICTELGLSLYSFRAALEHGQHDSLNAMLN